MSTRRRFPYLPYLPYLPHQPYPPCESNMRTMRARRIAALVFVVAASVAAVLVARPYVRGLSFVVRAAEMEGAVRRAADAGTVAVHTRDVSIATRRGPMRGRLYEPDGSHSRAALLTSGLHASGIDEPRLVRLARQLAASRLAVVTPDIPELTRFDIAPAITDAIEDAGQWLASDATLAGNQRVALMGISFSGGLSIVAAGRPSLRDRVAYVFSLGGHDDLPRVLRYLCTGQEQRPVARVQLASATGLPAPFVLPPHDYGVAVILLAIADRVVPAAQVERLREGVRQYLWASALDGGVDKSRAPAEFERVRRTIAALPEPSATLLRYVADRDVVHLGARLLPRLGSEGGDPALSVSRAPKPSAPVFLLHGMGDNVVPPVESEYLAEDLRGHAPVRILLSGLISHAEADQPAHLGDVLELASFWGDLLSR
jgi:dienelactone hydrolase